MKPRRRLLLPCLLATLAASACSTTAPRAGTGAASPAPGTPTAPAEAPPAATGASQATAGTAAAQVPDLAAPASTASTGNGLAIYEQFRGGLAEPGCDNAQARWRKHFSHAPQRLADPGTDTLALFGHVVESLREAGLPTEFALIPFIESGYAPGARSKAGPAGLWQFIAVTARSHGVRIEPGYDGRLSPAESTRAAVSYLKVLDDRFDGNWRLTLMAYNAGEYRVLQALRRSGADAATAAPGSVKGLPALTYAYVEKLHALACLIEDAGERPQWRASLDHPVPQLRAVPLEQARSLEAWAADNAQDPAMLRRLNPALAGHWPSRGAPWALVPRAGTGPSMVASAAADAGTALDGSTAAPSTGTYTVRAGDSAWSIARRHGVTTRKLLELNGLRSDSVLRPGMVLRLQ